MTTGIPRGMRRKVNIPELPRSATFKRQQSDLRDKLEPVRPEAEEWRRVSVDRRRSVSRSFSTNAAASPRLEAPELLETRENIGSVLDSYKTQPIATPDDEAQEYGADRGRNDFTQSPFTNAAAGGKEGSRTSMHSERSKTSTVLTRASNKVQVADIPGITVGEESKADATSLTPPVAEPLSSSSSPPHLKREPRRPRMQGYWQCDACGREVQHSTWGDYCPNCSHTRCEHCTWYQIAVTH
jgi:hypothetical protein